MRTRQAYSWKFVIATVSVTPSQFVTPPRAQKNATGFLPLPNESDPGLLRDSKFAERR